MWKSLEGKKTYIGAALLSLAVVAAWFGVVSPGQAATGAALGVALIGVGLGHKADRYGKAAVDAALLAKDLIDQRRTSGRVDLLKGGDEVARILKSLQHEGVNAMIERADRESKLAIVLAEQLAKHDAGAFHSSLTWNGTEWVRGERPARELKYEPVPDEAAQGPRVRAAQGGAVTQADGDGGDR